MSTPNALLPLDLYAVSPENKLTNYEVVVTNEQDSLFTLPHGPFYSEPQYLSILNSETGLYLTPQTDYTCVWYYEEASLRSAKEVMCAIKINSHVNYDRLIINARHIGGEYSRLSQPLAEIIDELAIDNRPVNWGDITGLPNQFLAAPHMHYVAEDTYGYDNMVFELGAIKEALLSGNQAALTEAIDYTLGLFSGLSNEIAVLRNELQSHRGATGNVHLLTKQQFGLEKLPNYSLATTAEMAARHTASLTSPYLVWISIDSAINGLNTSLRSYIDSEIDNAMAGITVTKASIGLSDVQNLGLATWAVVNSTSVPFTNGYLDVNIGRSILNKVATDLNAVNTNLNNRINGITRVSLGIDKVANFPIATQALVNANSAESYVTPNIMRWAIGQFSPVKTFQGRQPTSGNFTLIPDDRNTLGLGKNDIVEFKDVLVHDGAASNRIYRELNVEYDALTRNSDVIMHTFLPFYASGETIAQHHYLDTRHLDAPFVFYREYIIPTSLSYLSICTNNLANGGPIGGVHKRLHVINTSSMLTINLGITAGNINLIRNGRYRQINDMSEGLSLTLSVDISPTTRPIKWSNDFKWGSGKGAPVINDGKRHKLVFSYNTVTGVCDCRLVESYDS